MESDLYLVRMYYLGWLEFRSALSGHVQGHRPSALYKCIYQMKLYYARIQKGGEIRGIESFNLNELQNYSIYCNFADLTRI